MNQRQFLNKVNSESNEAGSMTFSYVCRLLENSIKEKGLVIRNNSIFAFLRKYSKIKIPSQIIEENFELILKKTCNDDIGRILILLLDDPETNRIVKENFDIIMNRFKHGEEYKNINDCIINILHVQQNEFFERLLEEDDGNELIQNNIQNILRSIPKKNLFKIAQTIRGISNQTDTEINDILEENKIDVAQSFLEIYTRARAITLFETGNVEPIESVSSKYALTLSIMIDELMKSENCRLIDIDYLSSGSYSTVYQIGNQVLKIGGPRETYEIPNHARILQPLTRTNFIDEKDNSVFACIEISEKVERLDAGLNTDEYLEEEQKQKEKLYQIYRDLRKDGIVWTDVRLKNVGKIHHANTSEKVLNGENIKVAYNSVGFTDEMKGKEIGDGDLVIIDTDYIYNEDDPNISWLSAGFASEFEKRWQQEIQAKIAEEHKKVNDKETIVSERGGKEDEKQ